MKKRNWISKSFFLNLLSYYLLFGCLEGAQQIKDPESLTHYDELIRYHPNLSGLIFSSCLKQYFKETDLAGQFFEKTVEGYKKFYNGRKIDCVIKAGFARTEEIGVRDTAKVRFFDFYFQDQQGPSKIHKLEEIQGMQIAGISTTTGFTQRLGGVLRQNSSE